jgi:hypothetical protein
VLRHPVTERARQADMMQRVLAVALALALALASADAAEWRGRGGNYVTAFAPGPALPHSGCRERLGAERCLAAPARIRCVFDTYLFIILLDLRFTARCAQEQGRGLGNVRRGAPQLHLSDRTAAPDARRRAH